MSGSPLASEAAREGATRAPILGASANYPLHPDAKHSLRVGVPIEEIDTGVPIADKERLFAQILHELRTPANVVIGYSDLLTDGAGGALPAKAAEMVNRVARSASHLRKLVDDLLDLTRIETGAVRFSLEELSLPVLLRDVLDWLAPQASAKGLAIRFLEEPAPPVLTDATRLRQIVLNLVSNAVRFTERGSVTVTLGMAHPDSVSVRVTDTGIGMTQEELKHIFEDYFQAGARAGGTGLGLTISRRLARLLGGDLRAESTRHAGSSFILTLPVSGPCAAEGVARSTPHVHAPQLR